MNERKDGGPAFPVEIHSAESIGDMVSKMPGLSLRDWFAAHAMQGLIASDVRTRMATFATKSYEMADAMLEARK
jgi:hypothetical protein